LNLRPLVPQTSALTGLRYAPTPERLVSISFGAAGVQPLKLILAIIPDETAPVRLKRPAAGEEPPGPVRRGPFRMPPVSHDFAEAKLKPSVHGGVRRPTAAQSRTPVDGRVAAEPVNTIRSKLWIVASY
jgi:hypothetical protein